MSVPISRLPLEVQLALTLAVPISQRPGVQSAIAQRLEHYSRIGTMCPPSVEDVERVERLAMLIGLTLIDEVRQHPYPCDRCNGTGTVTEVGRGEYEPDVELPCAACQNADFRGPTA